MAVFTSCLLVDIGLLVVPLLLYVVQFFRTRHNYWKDRGVPFIKPQMFFGNFKENILGRMNVIEVHEELYRALKGNRFGGYYEMHIPKMMILDPQLAYRILVKDFAHFHDRGGFPLDEQYDPLTASPANLSGREWRHLRYKLSPAFSTAKLKAMFDQIYNCGEDLMAELGRVADSKEPVEAKDVTSIFTSDVIASCAFGLQFKFNSAEGRPLKEMAKKAFPTGRFLVIKLMIRTTYTSFSKMVGLRSFSKEVTDYFVNLTKETARYRERHSVTRNDFFQLLLDLNKRKDHLEEEETDEDRLTNQLNHSSLIDNDMKINTGLSDECLAASAFTFLVTGSEVSTALSLLLYSIANNPEVQRKLQSEVDQVLDKHGGYSYEAFKDMSYMDQVLQESFRIMPLGGYLMRVCTIPYRIPDSDVVIEKGTTVVIPMWSIQRDADNYPDPQKFDPERFVGNNFKPSPSYVPFGDGPRMCMAMRFAVLEMKVCVARMLSKFSISLSSKTQQPLKIEPLYFFLRIKDGIWITVERRETA